MENEFRVSELISFMNEKSWEIEMILSIIIDYKKNQMFLFYGSFGFYFLHLYTAV